MEAVAGAILKHIANGGPGVAWALVVYLLLRLHQLTDRQHKANLDTVAALAAIKSWLMARSGKGELE